MQDDREAIACLLDLLARAVPYIEVCNEGPDNEITQKLLDDINTAFDKVEV